MPKSKDRLLGDFSDVNGPKWHDSSVTYLRWTPSISGGCLGKAYRQERGSCVAPAEFR